MDVRLSYLLCVCRQQSLRRTDYPFGVLPRSVCACVCVWPRNLKERRPRSSWTAALQKKKILYWECDMVVKMLSDVVLFKCVKLCIILSEVLPSCLKIWPTRYTDVSEKLPKQRVLRCVPYVVRSIVHVRRIERGALFKCFTMYTHFLTDVSEDPAQVELCAGRNSVQILWNT